MRQPFNPILLTVTLVATLLAGCNSPCGGSGNACCGAGVCNPSLVCVAGTCAANTVTQAKSQADICQQLAEGLARRDALGQLSQQAPLIAAAASGACPATDTQRIAVQTIQQQLVGLAASPLRSAACGDPQSLLSQRAGRIAAGLDAGRIVWNGPADAECQAGLVASAYLTTAVLSVDGGFPGAVQIFGPSGKPGTAPCDEVLQGQLQLGASCQDGTECEPGLYCQPADLTSCGGTCAVADGGCGPLTLCAGEGLPFVSLGGGLPPSLAMGTACDAGTGCGPCEVCSQSRCALAPGGLGSACPCPAPFLFCNSAGICEASPVLGGTCDPANQGCLQGSCLGTPPTCRLPGGIGDPCDLRIAGACDAGVCGLGPDSGAICQPAADAGQPGAGGSACALNAQCRSGFCVVPDAGLGAEPSDAGVCLSPCLQPPDSGCLNLHSNSSFLLGLGGALIIGKRHRAARRRRD